MTLNLGTAPTTPLASLAWATDAGALKTQPTTAYANAGYLATVPPSVHAQNWWQNLNYLWLTYLSGAVNTLNTGKLDKGGDTLTGTVAPIANDSTTATIGTASARFRGFFSLLTMYGGITFSSTVAAVIAFATNTRWTGSFVPNFDNTYDIGTTALKVRRVYANFLSGGTYPTDIFCESDFRLTANALGAITRASMILSWATFSGNGNFNYGININVATTSRPATGTYTIGFLNPLYGGTSYPAIIVTPQVGAGQAAMATYTLNSPTSITVRIYTAGSGNTAIDLPFSLTVIGTADF